MRFVKEHWSLIFLFGMILVLTWVKYWLIPRLLGWV